MTSLYIYLNNLLLAFEICAAIIGIYYYKSLVNTYWKWFVFYLLVIALQETIAYTRPNFKSFRLEDYYTFIGVPVQYLFWFWLYALKSLKNKPLFWVCFIIYLSSFIPLQLFDKKIETVYAINFDIGNTLLVVLALLEFIKQIRSDLIIKFWKNKMFYINIGILLFYVGTYPFMAFFDELKKEPYVYLWNAYYIYFLVSNCLMYLLFSISFICGKEK